MGGPWVSAVAMSGSKAPSITESVHAEENEEEFIVDNGLLRMTVDAHGLITHLVDLSLIHI